MRYTNPHVLYFTLLQFNRFTLNHNERRARNLGWPKRVDQSQIRMPCFTFHSFKSFQCIAAVSSMVMSDVYKTQDNLDSSLRSLFWSVAVTRLLLSIDLVYRTDAAQIQSDS